MPKKKLKPFSADVTIQHISEVITIKREGIADFTKVVLTVETPDGQVFFPELRYGKISYIKTLDLKVKDKVTIYFLFNGLEKDNRKYNNVSLLGITKK
jgi:hypothetical protein